MNTLKRQNLIQIGAKVSGIAHVCQLRGNVCKLRWTYSVTSRSLDSIPIELIVISSEMNLLYCFVSDFDTFFSVLKDFQAANKSLDFELFLKMNFFTKNSFFPILLMIKILWHFSFWNLA